MKKFRNFNTDVFVKKISHPEMTSKFNFRKKKEEICGTILKSSKDGQDRYALVCGKYTMKWSFPKGHKKLRENPIECALRETKEETGILIEQEPEHVVKLNTGVYFVFSFDANIPLKPLDKREIADAQWFTKDEMKNLSINRDVSAFVKL